MKFSIILFLISISLSSFSQKSYWTAAGSYIFSSSNASYSDPNNSGERINVSGPVRFTLWLNTNMFYNYDFNSKVGIQTGFGVNNIGFITDEKSSVTLVSDPDYNVNIKWKRRAYSLSVPLGLKIGDLDGFHLFIGGQYDWLFHYKEKEFLSTGKRKFTEWMSNRVTNFLPSAVVGIAFKKGIQLRFNYYLDDFMNKDYSYLNTANQTIKPYQDMDSRIMTLSIISGNIFRDYANSETTTKQIAVL